MSTIAPIEGASLTKNQDGTWLPAIVTSVDRVVPVDGIEVRNQDGYGIINLRLLHSTDQMTSWASDEMGSRSGVTFGRRVHQRINKVEIFEEGGYGITDLRFTSESGEQSGWLTDNAKRVLRDGSGYGRSGAYTSRQYTVCTYDVPAGKVLIGVVGKTQGNYGVVDVKFLLHDVS